jgi:hypothetical protein
LHKKIVLDTNCFFFLKNRPSEIFFAPVNIWQTAVAVYGRMLHTTCTRNNAMSATTAMMRVCSYERASEASRQISTATRFSASQLNGVV